MKRILSIVPVLFVLALFIATCQMQEGDSIYIQRLGNDTLTVETVTRTSEGYHGKFLTRRPATQVGEYEAQLTPGGTVGNLSVTWSTPEENPDGPANKSMKVSIEDTVAEVHLQGAWGQSQDMDSTYTLNVPEGTIPGIGTFPPAIGTYNQAINQAQGNYGDSGYPVNIIYPGRPSPLSGHLNNMEGDTVSLNLFNYNYPATVNDEGQITWVSALTTTLKTITKLENGNFEQMAAMFATRDANGNGMSVASPGDTVRATVNGASLEVAYSQPSMRGRKIWGGLVPWNEVWRTGANAATEFSTDRDLQMNGTTIPAGTYTLYSTYSPDSAKLIVNSQTGQWGTVYNKDQDFARIEMEKTQVDQPYEMFTISVDSSNGKGFLQLTWNTTRYQVPFTVKE